MPIQDPVPLALSGERISATYRIQASDEAAALRRARTSVWNRPSSSPRR
jgi:hypothetical protein